MRTIGTAVLVFEWMVFALAVPVAINVAGVEPVAALVLLGVVTVLVVAAAAKLPSRIGIVLGWLVQLVALASGFVLVAMAVLGAMFTGLWYLAVKLGTEVDVRDAVMKSQRGASSVEPDNKESSKQDNGSKQLSKGSMEL